MKTKGETTLTDLVEKNRKELLTRVKHSKSGYPGTGRNYNVLLGLREAGLVEQRSVVLDRFGRTSRWFLTELGAKWLKEAREDKAA